MTKTKFCIAVLTCIALLNSCKTLQISDLRPLNPSNPKLPMLVPKIDVQTLQNSYSSGSSISTGLGSAVAVGTIAIGSFASSSISFPDKRQQDIVTLFERDVADNICSGKESKGSVELKITFSHTKEGGWGYLVPAIFTAGIAWAFGMPMNTVTQELELQVEIKNSANVSVGKYTASAKAKTNVAAYSGYKKGDAPYMVQASVGRKANIDAYNEAMKIIKSQIQNDYTRLVQELK